MEAPRKTVDLSLVAWIVRKLCRAKILIGIDQLAGLISTVHRSLSGLSKERARAGTAAAGCLDSGDRCSATMSSASSAGFSARCSAGISASLTGSNPQGIRVRWKLPADHPITAPAYSERRSTLAKQIGLGRRPQEAVRVDAHTGSGRSAPEAALAANRDRQPRIPHGT